MWHPRALRDLPECTRYKCLEVGPGERGIAVIDNVCTEHGGNRFCRGRCSVEMTNSTMFGWWCLQRQHCAASSPCLEGRHCLLGALIVDFLIGLVDYHCTTAAWTSACRTTSTTAELRAASLRVYT
jgi:hypothetical protein